MIDQLVYYENYEVDSLKGWYWPKQDRQTFQIIGNDWVRQHRMIPNMMAAMGKDRRTVVQAGGNCGMYPKLLSRLFNNVYTFEPDPCNYAALSLNCISQFNIHKFQAALGDKPLMVSIDEVHEFNVGMNKIDLTPGTVAQITLDSFALDDVDLLWLDVETYELQALKGAKQLIDRNSPVIMCENPIPELVSYLDDTHSYKHIGSSAYDGIFVQKIS